MTKESEKPEAKTKVLPQEEIPEIKKPITEYNLKLNAIQMKFLSDQINQMKFGVGEYDKCKLATEIADIMNVEIRQVKITNLANQYAKDEAAKEAAEIEAKEAETEKDG